MATLKHVLTQDDTVLFIGSGISSWSGLPSWKELIEELSGFIEASNLNADLVRSEAQNGHLLQAASYGFEKLTKQQIGQFIRDTCRYGIAEPHEIHRKIISLGPRCFVTTNYDHLIEASLRKWGMDHFFSSPVTNRHLTEMADVVHARANNFIFKPHGDAADIESIILTREQYRQLLPQGERHAALESLKMLLATRPVVYLGFGLRDPDFLYVKEILANTYKGGARDHYALMADVSDAQCDFWRRHYGIHLVNYVTIERPDTTRDHTALLTLLDTLLERERESQIAVEFDPHAPDVVLALARHAASLSHTSRCDPEFQIRVHTEMEKLRGNLPVHELDRFDHSPVEKFLDDGPERAVLTGLPGSGKTYAIRRSAARLSERLHASCLAEQFDVKSVVVPILVDFKMYRGDLYKLVTQALPTSLPLEQVAGHFRIKVFLDSFNEMPREYWENGSYEADLAKFTKKIGESSIIISSRNSDGLDQQGFAIYSLDTIDEKDVAAELNRLDIDLTGQFSREVRTLLQRPFYFQYVISGAIRLPREAHPKDFYRLFFEKVYVDFETRIGIPVDLDRVLSSAAYEAINRGEEAFPLSEFRHVITSGDSLACGVDVDAEEIANWLVSSSVMTPYTGGRVAFVHQSFTEYLAAAELARRYQLNPDVLKDALSITRWDQALFLALSLLPPGKADSFLNNIIEADLALGLRAAKYLEVGRDEVVSTLLAAIPGRKLDFGSNDWAIEWAVQFDVPVTDTHEVHLRTLMELGGMIGAAGVIRLVELKGEGLQRELLHLLVDRCGDFNFCVNGIAPALKPFATEKDARKIAAWVDVVERGSYDGDVDGFIYGAAALLSDLDASVIRKEFLGTEQLEQVSGLRAQLLCAILGDMRSKAALELAGELLCRGTANAATAIYFIGKFPQAGDKLSWDSFGAIHIRHLISALDVDISFALDALKCLCAARPDLLKEVEEQASKRIGIEKAAVMHCVSPADFSRVLKALDELPKMSDEERQNQPVNLLRQLEFDWTGQEELFLQLLRLRDVSLSRALFPGGNPPSLRGLGNVDIGPVFWWLEWMMEVEADDSNAWCLYQLGGFFGKHLDRELQQEFLVEFNRGSSKVRRLLLRFVLPYIMDITTEMFSGEAISFLLDDLNHEHNRSHFGGHLLGRIATERFITERLLPLLEDPGQPFSRNLRSVLKQAGSRHGKRYFLELPT